MLTLNNILKEIKDIPASRLEDVYQFVHSISSPKKKSSDALRKKILSYGGAFSSISEKDYAEFKEQTQKTRTTLFDRNMAI